MLTGGRHENCDHSGKKMRKKIKQIKTRSHSLKKSKVDIRPFVEHPSNSKTPGESEKSLQASELFSIFTANIIKEDKIFIR